MKRFAKTLWDRRGVVWDLAVLDVRRRYTRTAFGLGWALAKPAATFLLYLTVFGWILQFKTAGAAGGGAGYGLFLLAALVPWFLLSDSVSRAADLFVNNKTLIRSLRYPAELLPLSTFLSAAFDHAIALALLLAVRLLFIGWPGWSLLGFIPLFALTFVMMMGCMWAVATLSVFARDLGHLADVVMSFAFFLTPVVYPLSMVPPFLRWCFYLNPFFYVVTAYRSVFLDGTLPSAGVALGLTAWSAVSVVVGWRVWTRFRRPLVDYL